MRARDDQGGNGGRGKRLLNRGMTNGNYIGKRSETGAAEEGRAKEDNHVLHAALGFGLFTDGPDRLGWLINMQGVSAPLLAAVVHPHLCLASRLPPPLCLLTPCPAPHTHT